MSYIIRNDRVIGKTEAEFQADLLVWCCPMGKDAEDNLHILSMPLLRKHPNAFKARISNDPKYAEIAKELCYFALVRSISPLSIEIITLYEPPF